MILGARPSWSSIALAAVAVILGLAGVGDVPGKFPGGRVQAAEPRPGIFNPLHEYETRPVDDRFSRYLTNLEAGEAKLDTSSEQAMLVGLLKDLEVPVSSQMLVYTATSLQKGLISPRNPRALYFNDDTYVGFVPGGRIEVLSLDPTLGGVFYLFDRLQPGRQPKVRRTSDCMNCHAPRHMDNVPGLVIESVIPGMTGGGERAFRREQSGHQVALGDRFGGWHLTGTGPALTQHWGNLLIQRKNGEAKELPNPPGERFDLSRYPVPTSDLLAQLLHEHQAGFVNRALRAGYGYRELAAAGDVSDEALAEYSQALVSYLLFKDEAPLTPGMVGDSPLAADFVASAKRDAAGRSLRDVDGKTRLLRYRCSYMIYSPTFTGLPDPLRKRVLTDLAAELKDPANESHLPVEERAALHEILTETLPEYAELAGSSAVK
jgi:hypothetical protein